MNPGAVAYAIDARYALPLAVSLRSLVARAAVPPEVYVLECGVSRQERAKVERHAGIAIHWISVEPIAGLTAGLHFSPANYFRLMLPTALSHLDRVLYLDADTLVLADIGELFSLARHDTPLQACRDYCGTISNPLIGLPGFADFGVTADMPYFNSGVLLMNLSTWRAEKLAQQVIEFGRKHPETTFFADQTAINLVLRDRIHELPADWNGQTVHPNVIEGVWRVPYVAQNLSTAKILHYTSEFKPWGIGREQPASRPWLAARAELSWD